VYRREHPPQPSLRNRVPTDVQVRPNRWRALPTAILVIGAILLGAVTARADVPQGHAHASAAASSSAAIR
jgi:hypothetical protein